MMNLLERLIPVALPVPVGARVHRHVCKDSLPTRVALPVDLGKVSALSKARVLEALQRIAPATSREVYEACLQVSPCMVDVAIRHLVHEGLIECLGVGGANGRARTWGVVGEVPDA